MSGKHEAKGVQVEGQTVEQADVEGQLSDNLLASHERDILGEIAKLDAPHGQRAKILLALDEGATQTAAGEMVGLSSRQVRYWRGKFLEQRLGIFPEELLEQSGSQPQALESGGGEELQPDAAKNEIEDAREESDASEKQSKAKKSKKAKGKKKKKKDKKSKKKAAKKGKKSKKGKKPGKSKGRKK